jgi:D-sedoheptulose 7-phosphate isomerase
MSTARTGDSLESAVGSLLARRRDASRRFFGEEADRVASLCRVLAECFEHGGRLLALGSSPQARSDARHLAVELMHPVIVGKRALPALALGPEGGPLGPQVALAARPADAVVAFGPPTASTAAAIGLARARGCVTVGFGGTGADWELEPPATDPFVRQELVETLYHLLWELVHVFLDQLVGTDAGAGAAGFLYPFLGDERPDGDGLLDDVRRSVLAKAEETDELRAATLTDGRGVLVAAARALRRSFDDGGQLLAFGNGGSATDAMDLVADLRDPPQGSGWPARRALDLCEDPAVLTALANDVGPQVVFARQVAALGRPGDVALAFSTSGGSPNVLAALSEARRRGLYTVALAGYGGGEIAADRLADHVVATPSQHVPRIQEAQASAYHVLRELVELA